MTDTIRREQNEARLRDGDSKMKSKQVDYGSKKESSVRSKNKRRRGKKIGLLRRKGESKASDGILTTEVPYRDTTPKPRQTKKKKKRKKKTQPTQKHTSGRTTLCAPLSRRALIPVVAMTLGKKKVFLGKGRGRSIALSLNPENLSIECTTNLITTREDGIADAVPH